MKHSLSLLFVLTFALSIARGADAPPKTGGPIEICFVLDTTGSMGGLIDGAKQKIWSIANDVIGTKPKPTSIKISLVAYRDKGDVYVTKVFDLTDDIDTVYKNLQTFQAEGGGDEPESVNQALDEAVEKVSWSKDADVMKIVFLVGDAPPHMDYKDDVKYPEVLKKGVKKNLIFNTVQCGNISSTTPIWKEIAKLGEGSYIQLGQTGDMVVVATPMDKDLAELNKQMGQTLVPYGQNGALRREDATRQADKQAASEVAAPSVAADRLSFNSRSNKAVQGNDELLDAIAENRATLKDLKDDQLPEDLRKLSPEDREAKVKKLTEERDRLRKKISDLTRRREEYIAGEKKKQAGGKGDSFDQEVAKTIADELSRNRK